MKKLINKIRLSLPMMIQRKIKEKPVKQTLSLKHQLTLLSQELPVEVRLKNNKMPTKFKKILIPRFKRSQLHLLDPLNMNHCGVVT